MSSTKLLVALIFVIMHKWSKQNMNTLNKRIQHYRKVNKHTQKYMAERMGITQSAYSQFENADTDSMRVITLKKFCEEFSVSADWLLGLKDEDK